MGQNQVSGGVSALCWLAAPVAMFYVNLPKFGNKVEIGSKVKFGNKFTNWCNVNWGCHCIWSCNIMERETAYSSGHLVLSHLGLAFVLMLRPFFPELVMSMSFEHPSLLLFCFIMFNEIPITTIKLPEGRFQTFPDISLSDESRAALRIKHS